MRKEKLLNELVFKSVKASGPGGQHVNKTSSAAVATWSILDSEAINLEQRKILLRKLTLNKKHELVIKSSVFKSLKQNKVECEQRFLNILKEALKRPKKRIPTKPTKASKVKKRESKEKRSKIKKLRGKVKY